MKKTWLICLVLASFVCGCQSKKESNAVLFEKFLDKNVASFAKVMAESGVDTIQAKKYCRCVFTQLYGIDSTFFKLPNDSINSLIDKHSLLIEEKCGNLKKWLSLLFRSTAGNRFLSSSFHYPLKRPVDGGGRPVVNRDPTLSPQSPFSLLSFVILLGTWHKYWRQIWKDVISLAERRMKGYPYIINRLIIWMFWLKCKDERRTRITDLVRGSDAIYPYTKRCRALLKTSRPFGNAYIRIGSRVYSRWATRTYASGHTYVRVSLYIYMDIRWCEI